MTEEPRKDMRLLRQIAPKNLLSFGPETVPLDLKSLNLLICPNASGKSNLIEALEREELGAWFEKYRLGHAGRRRGPAGTTHVDLYGNMDCCRPEDLESILWEQTSGICAPASCKSGKTTVSQAS